MKILNETKLPTRAVADIIRRAARDLEVEDESYLIRVKHTRRSSYAGRCYPDGPGHIWNEAYGVWVAPEMHGQRGLIVLRVADPPLYPMLCNKYERIDGPSDWVCETWQEALASIAGHELMHVRQYLRERTKGRKGGKRHVRGKFNEVETDWAAFRAWRREREHQAKLTAKRSVS